MIDSKMKLFLAFSLAVASVPALAGCVTSQSDLSGGLFVPSSEVLTDRVDEFDGSRFVSLTNFVAAADGSALDEWVFVSPSYYASANTGSGLWSVVIRLGRKRWLFADRVELLIDGEPVNLPAKRLTQDIATARVRGRTPLVTEVLVAAVDRSTIEQIASASTLKVRVSGSRGRVTREFKASNFWAFAAAVAVVDGRPMCRATASSSRRPTVSSAGSRPRGTSASTPSATASGPSSSLARTSASREVRRGGGDRMITTTDAVGDWRRSLNRGSLRCTLRRRRTTLLTPADGVSSSQRAARMRFALHDLHPNQFEDFVVEVCHELLGAGVQKFATGPDGGRDAKFVGTAQAFPSRAEPLSGIVIIQAKHTIDAVGKFSDSDFGGQSSSATLSEEIPRIKVLREAGQINHYLLFANRRLGAIANEHITARLVEETGVTSIHLFGEEQLERYVKRYHYLATTLRDFEYDLPLRASPDDLAEVISAIADAQSDLDWPTSISATSLQRVAFKRKNQINGLSDEYARYITRNYLKHFGVVEKFLADPLNAVAYASYNNAVDEFAGKLVAYREDFGNYDKLLDYMLSVLIKRDGDLRAHRRLTRTVFYFMYWACDIGETEVGDDPAD